MRARLPSASGCSRRSSSRRCGRTRPCWRMQAASVDVLSGGRLTLGLAVGGREDDFDVSGVDFRKRGATFDRQLDEMARLWKGEKVGFAGGVGPQPRDGRPEVVSGGTSDAAFRRSAQHAGWMMGGGPPDNFSASVPKLNSAWE